MAQRGFHDGMFPLFTPSGDGDEAASSTLTGDRLPSYIADHRARLRARFRDGGAAALPDYEMLELVLFRAIPRQDVKPLARLLLDTFGDYNRVITAAPARLSMVKGVGEAVITELKIIEAAAQRLMRARVMNRPSCRPGMRWWIIATPPCPTAKPNNSASCFWTAKMC